MSLRSALVPRLMHLVRPVLVTLWVALLCLSMTQIVQAQGGEPQGSGGFAGQPLVDVLVALAKLIVQFVVLASVALLAANIARGMFSAQLANLIGSPAGMSQAWLNLIGAVITFVLAALSPMIVGIIFDAVKGFVQTSFTIPTF